MKEKEQTKQERVRKAYAPAGIRTQKMISLRVDLDILDYLNSKPNKGRYINDLIRTERERHSNTPKA